MGLGVAYFSHALYKARHPTLPGPPGIPLFGNLLQIGKNPHRILTHWARKYGDVYFLNLGWVKWMVIMTPDAMNDVFVRKSRYFSDRPNQTMLSQILTHESSGMVTVPYGPDYKVRRRIFTSAMSKPVVRSYNDFLISEARHMCRSIYTDSAKHGSYGMSPHHNHQWYAINLVLSMTFGIRLGSKDDHLCGEFQRLNDLFFAMSGPSSCMIDFFPFLSPFLRGQKAEAAKVRESIVGFMHEHFERFLAHREKVISKVPTVLARYVAESLEAGEINEKTAHILLMEAFEAGLDTTSVALSWMSMLLACNPHVQAKAREEMDRVVGRDRMPTPEDLASLPYIRCVIQESLRMRGPARISPARACSEDMEYRGMHVPKGTWVMASLQGVMTDFSTVDEPYKFRPERWEPESLSLSEEATRKQSDRVSWAFGGGRRVCPGLYLAETSLTLTLASLIWSFEIGWGEGEVFDIEEMEDGLTNCPASRRLTYTPRGDFVKTGLFRGESSPVETI
ncbi:cytochrome P450 [Piptocephalis cylindrospora]|uniref:Cytochrome P450 n=1 Tax=Piptocephalis cylindrospora TaxID=1907219 RepID=A0A4P9Y148_9FUNG|nr:cytochrome P450 [Piptocephalis cylindrospora]|eukprot:RKP12222.1 cytochrome P450 [Piptocephalis cylindrospora]